MIPNKKKKDDNSNESYKRLNASLSSGQMGNFYIFFGEERYLLHRSLEQLRALLCPDGLDSFNYKRFEGNELLVEELEGAIETFPAFAERSLIEIHDFNIFKNDNLQYLSDILSDLPDYVCVVFVFSTLEYKPDKRVSIVKKILKYADVIEFVVQEQGELLGWIRRHFRAAGKNISKENMIYIATLTGGLMTIMDGEIEKAAAYAKQETVTREDIDAVVNPVLDTVVYNLTDALVSKNHPLALRLLDELFQMREPPHKLLFSIALKMRQLLTARICLENNINKTRFREMCAIRYDFISDPIYNTARKATLSDCRNAVLYSSATALELNSTSDPESRLIELVAKLAYTG